MTKTYRDSLQETVKLACKGIDLKIVPIPGFDIPT